MIPPYSAQLRVYEPLAAFPAGERRHWEDYLHRGRAPGRVHGPALERAVGLGAALRSAARVPREGDLAEHAYVTYVDGVPLICPWRLTVRCWQAAADLATTMPERVVASMLSRTEIAAAAAARARWSSCHPDLRVHVMTNRWSVPVRWFLLFDRAERRLRLGADTDQHRRPVDAVVERSLVYATEMSAARRRAARALAALRKAAAGGPVLSSVEDVARWLEEFHPRSVVELDYGGLVYLLGDEELRADDSAGDVAVAMAALGRGDIEDAATAYDRVITRWRTAQLVESAN
ncbi:MAG TPA: hypothetical protein VFX70_08515 [Mycobacteriales bacterium]|nr:hypothetical protein [Mycobacteriales bacterium]